MILYLDRDTGTFIDSPLFKMPVETVSFKRGDAADIELRFVSGNTVTGLASGATVSLGVKEQNKFDADFLAYAYTDEFTSVSNSYYLSPSFNTEQLNGALNVDGDPANDVGSLTAMLEVSWSESSGVWQSSRTITATILNDVIRGSEGTPVELDGPEDWLLENAIGLGTPSNPFTIAGTISPDINGVLYPAGGAYSYSLDGADEAPLSGTWVGVTWDASESLHRIQVYVDGAEATGTWHGGGSDPGAPEAGSYTADGSTTGNATVTIGALAPATHAFMTNGAALFVNLGSAAIPLWHVINSDPA